MNQKFYEECKVCSTEPALESLSNIKQGTELMRTKHCLKYASGLCQKSSKKLYLIDDKGKKYPLKFDCKNCEMVILNP